MKRQLPALIAVLLVAIAYGCCSNPYRLEELLNMKDVSHRSAIPALEKILKEGGRSIYPCAAAQALFLMDSEESKAILAKYLSYPHYDFDYSITLAFHWGIMEPCKRDEFIRTYHLKNQSEDVSIHITAVPTTDQTAGIRFTISLVNTSGKLLRFYKPSRYYPGECILLATKRGEFMKSEQTTVYSLSRSGTSEDAYPEVAPGKSLDFSFVGTPTSYSGSLDTEFRDNLWLDCGDFSHKLTTAGTFKVYALYEYRSTPEPPFANIWTGRVVSEPIEIEIRQPAKPNKLDADAGK